MKSQPPYLSLLWHCCMSVCMTTSCCLLSVPMRCDCVGLNSVRTTNCNNNNIIINNSNARYNDTSWLAETETKGNKQKEQRSLLFLNTKKKQHNNKANARIYLKAHFDGSFSIK